MDHFKVQTAGKVNVIIPAYRSGAVLEMAVQSVLRQNYSNLQLIVCDDGTEGFDKDELETLIRKKREGIPYYIIHQQENIGTVRNLNIGLEHTQGEWVFLLAADDLLADSTVISRLVCQAMESNLDWVIPRTELCDTKMNR